MPIFRLVIIAAFLLLSACTHHVVHRDGPPHFYVDETRIPNAKPKVEPLAKYGNLPSYRVFGVRYYTLHSNKNYEAIGTASWYGTQFHRHATSSGEPYNMLAMTAAHKTLPLPTYLEVTNLKNKRKIIVKVNDRGPFSGNRLIDLSYVAAKKLGMLGHGTALVKIKAIDPQTFDSNPTHIYAKNTVQVQHPVIKEHLLTGHAHSQQRIYLQVGAFKEHQRAVHLQKVLATNLKMPVTIKHLQLGDKLFRVQIGPLKNKAALQQLAKRLKSNRYGLKSSQIVAQTGI